MHQYEGGCHCGNIGVQLDASVPIEQLPIRACQCSFCRKHNVRATSDPAGHLTVTIADADKVNRYRFGLGITDFLICRECGTYVCALIEDGEQQLATLVANTLAVDQQRIPTPVPAHYDDETENMRRQRRRERWMPATVREVP